MVTAELSSNTLLAGHDVITMQVVLASTGSEVALQRGAPLGRVTATRKFKAWNPAASDGSEVIVALLTEAKTVPAAGDAKSDGYVHGEFHKNAIPWGAATADQISDAVWAMAGRGIYVR
jgi:hypothetical protein